MKKLLLFFSFLSSLSALAQSATDTIKDIALPEVEIKGVTTKSFDSSQISCSYYIHKPADRIVTTNAEPSLAFQKIAPSVSMHIESGGSNGYSYIRMRGIDQTRINFYLNGVPMNEAEDRGFYFSNFPDFLRSVKEMTISYGLAGINTANTSTAGNMQFYTPESFFDKAVKVGVGGGSFYSFNAFAEGQTAISKKTAFYGRASVVKSNGYKAHSGNFGYSGFASFLYKEKNNSLWVNLLHGRQANSLAWLGVPIDSIKINPRKNGNSADEKDNFMQTQVQLIDELFINKNSSIKACGYYTNVKGYYTFDLNNFYQLSGLGELYKYAIHSHEGGGYFFYNYLKKAFGMQWGAQGSYYKRYHIGSEKTAGELYQNYGQKAEINLQAKLHYNLWRFTFKAGAQYRYVNFRYKGDVSYPVQQWHFINYQAGINFKIKDNIILYYSFGSNSREPSRNDLFIGNDNLYADSLGNPIVLSISPEHCFDHELGVKWNGKRHFLSANLYVMQFKNEIALNGQYGPTGLPLKSNNTQSLRSGLELRFDYRFKFGLSLNHNSSYSYNFIKNGSEKAQPVLTPNFIVNQSVGYEKWGWGLTLHGRYQSAAYIDFENKHKLPQFGTLDIELSKQIKGFYLFAKLNNVTNSVLYNYGALDYSGNPVYFIQAPFNFYIGANWQIVGKKNK